MLRLLKAKGKDLSKEEKAKIKAALRLSLGFWAYNGPQGKRVVGFYGVGFRSVSWGWGVGLLVEGSSFRAQVNDKGFFHYFWVSDVVEGVILLCSVSLGFRMLWRVGAGSFTQFGLLCLLQGLRSL